MELKHLPHYVSLVIVLVIGVFAFSAFSYDQVLQVAVSVSVAGAYIVWGVVHHLQHKDFHLSVVIEYVIVAMLGLIVVLSLILRF